MIIDTVRELFSYFNTIPRRIVYFGNKYNIQDSEYFDHTKEDVNAKFLNFLSVYGDRELVDFTVDGIEEAIHIEIC